MPWSHLDPGWLVTAEDYFNMYVISIFDLLLEHFPGDETLRFTVVEVRVLSFSNFVSVS